MSTPFAPSYGSSQTVSPAASSATITLPTGNRSVRIVNTGASIAYVRIFNSQSGALAATVADFPVPAGMASTITKGPYDDRLAHISAGGTTLQIMVGEGM